MTKEELRDRYLKEMPSKIFEGQSYNYADFLEDLIVTITSDKLKCPHCNSTNTAPWGIDFDWCCGNCGEDFQGVLQT